MKENLENISLLFLIFHAGKDENFSLMIISQKFELDFTHFSRTNLIQV